MANTNIFEDLQLPDLPHSDFDLSHNVKLSTVFHRITPIFCEECLPGDRWEIDTKPFIRTQPMLAPVMDNCDVDVRFFFVPNRLIWSDWEDFVTGGKDGMAAPITPHFTVENVYTSEIRDNQHKAARLATFFRTGHLLDYLGYPSFPFDTHNWESAVRWYTQMPASYKNKRINSLPVRAFAQIWNDYYQDRNLLVNPEEKDFSKSSGNEFTLENYGTGNLLDNPKLFFAPPQVACLKDYFTSALPFAQRGPQASIKFDIPSQRVNGLGSYHDVQFTSNVATARWMETGNNQYAIRYGKSPSTSGANPGDLNYPWIGTTEGQGGFSMTINQFRQLTALQRYYETNSRGGSRYVEQLLTRWNVISEDSRLQRAEYLGGSRAPLMISEVMQSAPFEGASGEQPLGTLAGKAVSSDHSHIEHYCYEHGWLIGLMYLRPQPTYSQGLHKKFTRMYNTDYYLPEFANLGEQEIAQSELYFSDNKEAQSIPEGLFGYTPRYAEYKWLGNRLAGDFKGSLKYWTFARDLQSSTAQLNSNFLRPKASEFDDAFAVQDGSDNILAQVNHHIQCRRAMPMFPVPELK